MVDDCLQSKVSIVTGDLSSLVSVPDLAVCTMESLNCLVSNEARFTAKVATSSSFDMGG